MGQPETTKAVPESSDVEGHQETDRDAGQSQVRDDLRQMDGQQALDGFEQTGPQAPVHLDERSDDWFGPIPKLPSLLLSLFHTHPSVAAVGPLRELPKATHPKAGWGGISIIWRRDRQSRSVRSVI